ncbi:MAG: NADH-quinone oxidoreductase subunit J [Candidatus Thermoplasmatota archaeon]
MNRRIQLALAALVALGILLVLLLSIRATAPWADTAATEATTGRANDMAALTDALFGPEVIAFEVLGVLLTAVMIGALVIARPLTVTGTEESSLVHPNLTVVAPAAPVEPKEGTP